MDDTSGVRKTCPIVLFKVAQPPIAQRQIEDRAATEDQPFVTRAKILLIKRNDESTPITNIDNTIQPPTHHTIMTDNSISIISSDTTAAAPIDPDTFPRLADLKPHLPTSPSSPHFTDEAILILSKFSKLRNDSFDSWQDELTDYEDVRDKSLELFNWLALSLVPTPADAVALTTYMYHEGFKLIVATQQTSEQIITHANEFADIVRAAAREGSDLVEFRASYFACLLRNCREMIELRYNELRRAMSEICESSDEDGDMRVRKTALEEITTLLRTTRTRKKGLFDHVGEADDEAENLTGKSNIYVALGVLFATLKRAMATPPTEDTIVNLCAMCWILARSRVLQSCVYRENPASANLMVKLSAMGAYYRGVGFLHQVMEDGVYKRYFDGLKVEFIPSPQPRNVELHDDWFHVMETIYSRQKGGSKLHRQSGYSVANIPHAYQRAVHAYTAHLSARFITHPEKHLLNFLISRGYQARRVGVSRYCCFLCAAYFESLNQGGADIKFEVGNQEKMNWSVGGHCGDVAMWGRDEEVDGVFATAEEVVREQIEKEVCEIAKDFVRSGSEGRGFFF